MRIARNFLPLIAIPIIAFAFELPVMFGDAAIHFGATEMVSLTPDLQKIDKEKIYPECPDHLYTYKTFLDSMTGRSLKLRLFYNKFGLGKFVANALDFIPDGRETEMDVELGRHFLQFESTNFEKYLKKAKRKFWKEIAIEAKVKKIPISQIKKEYKELLKFESELIEDLLKMNDNDLLQLTLMFNEPYYSDYRYWSGETDYGNDSLISYRKRVNNFMQSMANMYKWKTRLFVMQANGENGMDYGWYLNISTMVKYDFEKSERAVLLRLKKTIEMLE